MMNKKIIYVIGIIALLIIGVILGIKMGTDDDSDKNQVTNNTEVNMENEVKQNDIVEENAIEEDNKTIEDTIDENEIEENTVNENITELNTKNENTTKENKEKDNKTKENITNNSKNNTTSKQTEQDLEKRAIALAKEKWGNTNNDVYFDVEDESKGIYTIVVRDNNTTVEMITYKVDVNKKTVTEQ